MNMNNDIESDCGKFVCLEFLKEEKAFGQRTIISLQNTASYVSRGGEGSSPLGII